MIPKSKPIFQKFNNLNLKTNGDLFIENIDICSHVKKMLIY